MNNTERSEVRTTCNIAAVSNDNIRQLLVEAANRSASYLEALSARVVRADRDAVERFTKAVDGPLPDEPSRPADILAFLDEHGSPPRPIAGGCCRCSRPRCYTWYELPSVPCCS